MDNDDLEKTRALNELSDIIKEKQGSEFIDIPDDINNTDKEKNKEKLYNNLVDNDEKDKKSKDKKGNKNKKSLKDRWSDLPKNKKIIVIVSCVLILVLLIVLLIILLSPKKENPKPEIKDDIVFAKDNYKYQNGFLTIYDDSENSLGTYECENKDEKLCYVAYLNNDEDPFDITINKYQDDTLIKTRSSVYSDRFVFIFDQSSEKENSIKLYDMQDNSVIGEYNGLKSYPVENKNIVVLKNKDDKYGLFEFSNQKLNTLIDFNYQFMGLIDKESDNLVVVRDANGYMLVDYDGNSKSKAFTNDIVNYNDKYIIVKNSSKKYSVYDYEGEEYNKNYNYIKFLSDDYLAVVKDNNLYVRDFEEHKYNEEGLELTNDSYNKVNIYDDNKKLVSSTFAFDYELHEKILTFKLMNSDNTTREEKIDLGEGDISKNYKYYSYFNNKLYFYDNEDKKNLIGSYECHNANSTSGDKFTNCLAAKDSAFNDSYINPYVERNAIIALYNKRFVFIYDVPELSNESNTEIKFYDLSQNKIIGTYSALDANMPNDTNDLTLIDTNNVKIIAKLKSGNYGVIEINSKDAVVAHKFEYKHIERAGNNYIVQLGNGNWQIIYSNNYTSNEFPGKIMNFENNHLVIKNGDKVYIYKSDGYALLETGFNYIDISNSKYFGAVLNNKLYVYDYDGNKVNDDEIVLTTNNYEGTRPLIAITVNGTNVIVSVRDQNGTISYSKTYSTEKNTITPDEENELTPEDNQNEEEENE